MLSPDSLCFANIKNVLQMELFNGCGERLLSVLTVTKTFKTKKRLYYICIATTPPPVPQVTVCLVKQSEQNYRKYKKKRIWQLDEIKWLEGHSEQFDIHELDIQVEKLYKWYALNLHERQNFLAVLYKQIHKYCRGTKAEFRNVPGEWLMDTSPEKLLEMGGGRGSSSVGDGTGRGGLRKSAAKTEESNLTDKEANQLSTLFNQSDYAVKDAELLIEQLSKELHDLDGANMESVLTSEKQVMLLMEHIDKAIGEVDKFEVRLDSYEKILGHVKETMEKIGENNAMINIENNNNITLKEELSKIVTQLDLPVTYQQVLQAPDLKTADGRKAAILAAQSLQQALNSDIDPSLQRLVAVRDQMKRIDNWKTIFLQAVYEHLNCLFNDLSKHFNSIVLIERNYYELTPYTKLMHWIKAMDRTKYDGLKVVYTKSLSKIYERDIHNLFTLAKLQISEKLRNSHDDLDSTYGILGVHRDKWGPGIEIVVREHFDAVLENVLVKLESIALQEQKFCINFFQIAISANLDVMDKNIDMSQYLPLSSSTDRQINEDVRKLMNALFGCLESELVNFIQSFERFDCFYFVYVSERFTQHKSAQDTHSFLNITFEYVLAHVKRDFDRFMQQQLQSIRDAKLPKRSKCGILPYVENFEYFSQTTEDFFRKSTRRTDMEKYIQLINAIFVGINNHAKDHTKTPVQVVRMENYHHMYSLLARLKVPSLDELKKEAKSRYNEALTNYVIQYFGRPLEKLNLFFEDVQQKIAQGVKETEISYQMAFSKQELRKVISQYPAREVKKGLKNLYKTVEKDLCVEENLLQVVWHAMQEEFIVQYKFLEERIQICYAGSKISLKFNIQEILNFFSDIASSH